MQRSSPFFLLVLAIGLSVLTQTPTRACTSFAVYSDKTYYGMNFDYDPSIEMRLFIDSGGGDRAFHLAFIGGGRALRTVGMNSAGLFASLQELYPEKPGKAALAPDEMYVWQVYFTALAELSTVEEVAKLVESKRLVHLASKTLHVLVADAGGNAMVFEPGDEDNAITPIEGDFIVMANFPNAEVAGRSCDEIHGVGADRYAAAFHHLSENLEALDIRIAFEALKKAAWEWTRSSMVFDPDAGEVYVSLERDYDRVLRVSIDTGTIETYSGYDEAIEWHPGSRGIPTTTLEEAKPAPLTRLLRLLGIR